MASKARKIAEYIDGTLTGVEHEEFKAELIQNPKILCEVEFSQRSMMPLGTKAK